MDNLRWHRSSYSGANGGNCVEVTWRKSSYSGANGGHCVEVGWRRSSYSTANGGACVEAARRERTAGVRDSKAPDAGALWLAEPAWRAFLTELDSPER